MQQPQKGRDRSCWRRMFRERRRLLGGPAEAPWGRGARASPKQRWADGRTDATRDDDDGDDACPAPPPPPPPGAARLGSCFDSRPADLDKYENIFGAGHCATAPVAAMISSPSGRAVITPLGPQEQQLLLLLVITSHAEESHSFHVRTRGILPHSRPLLLLFTQMRRRRHRSLVLSFQGYAKQGAPSRKRKRR